MLIAVDFQSTQGRPTGIGVAAANLIASVERREASIKLLKYKRSSDRDLNAAGRVLWESWEIPARARRDKADLIYSPGFAPAFWASAPQVVTVHDLIGMIYPKNLRGGAKFYWSFWLPACVKRAKTIVASSESTRRDITRLLGISESKIEVVPLGAGAAFRRLADSALVEGVKRKHGLNRPYFLAVGTLEPRKNLPNLLRAFDAFRRKNGSETMLAICGKNGGERAKLETLVSGLALTSHVKFLDYVPDEDLASLYNGALGYVFISSYEGFGLPALEAMCCGISGIVSNVSSLPEVVGDAALYVDPANVAEIADRFEEFYRNGALRASLGRAAFERSMQFGWDRAAEQMIRIFKRSAI